MRRVLFDIQFHLYNRLRAEECAQHTGSPARNTMPSSIFPSFRNVAFRLHLNFVTALGAALLFSAGGLSATAQTSARVWFITMSSTTSQTGLYTVNVDGDATATNPTDVSSTPSASYSTLDGLAIDPAYGHYFLANYSPTGPDGDTNQILKGNISGGAPLVIYTSGNSGGDAIVGLALDPQTGLLYFAVTDVNVPSPNTDTGIYYINARGTGVQTATKLVNLSSAANAPNDIAIDTTNNLLFYTNGIPGLTNVEDIGVANLTTGAIINSDLVSYSASGSVEPFGIAVDPATDTLYWTTVNYTANSGNTIYSAKYSTGASVTLSDTQTLATTSLSQVPVGISLDVPAGGYYVDTSTGTSGDTTSNEILFGSSLTSPATLTNVYSVPDQDSGTETLPTEGIVVEVQPVVDTSGTVTFVHGDGATEIDSGATVSDADGYYIAGATVSIASGAGTGDTLSFTNQNGITGSFSSGTLTLTGAATAADYEEALDSVTFSTTSTSATARTLDWTVSDGILSSATTTSTVDVHIPPTVTAGATVTFDGGGSPVVLDSGLTVSDESSSTLISATVSIASGFGAGDTLSFTNQNGITGSFGAGTLSLTGTATVADYQAALESVTFSTTSTSVTPRTIDWNVSDSVVSSATATSTVDVLIPPAITSANSATFTVGSSGSFTVTASGDPAPTFSETGILPSGVTMNSGGTLSGTPAAGTGGTYPLTITAANGVSPNATQSFTLTVDQPPAISSAASTTFTVGRAGSFTVTSTGHPTAAFSETGGLPSGVTLIDNGNGTATLSGTPAAGSGGTYSLTITAANGVAPNATQSFALTVDQPPSISSAASTTFVAGLAGSFTATASGYPAPSFSETGILPSGVTMSSNGTLSGTPGAGTGGIYSITITAANGVSPNGTQSFTLTVDQSPAITSSESATFTTGVAGSFTVTTTAYPTPALSKTGVLPSGVTFVDNGNGTATLAGTPASGTAGSYPLTIQVVNGVSPNGMQSFTLTVNPPPAFVVTTNTDDATGTPSNCPIPSSGNTCTLRDALAAAASAGSGNITFSSSVFSTSNSTAQNTIKLSNGTLNIPSNTTITGPTSGSGHTLVNLVTVAGGGASSNFSVFAVNSGVIAASINDLTISNGNTSGNGGGINNNGTLTVSNSTISGNTASQNGGGIADSGTLTLTYSTLSGNQAQNGGGIADGGTTSLIGSTISGNQAAQSGGGIASQTGTTGLANSIVSGNTGAASAADDIDSASGNGYTNNGGNVVGTVNGVAVNPGLIQLGVLANYGGPTQTMIPLPGSVAICAGLANNIPSGATTDQRGYPNENTTYPGYNSSNPCVDSGAVQTNYGLQFTTEPQSSVLEYYPLNSPAPVVGLTESGVAFAASSGTVNMTDTSTYLGGTTSEALTSGSASFGNLAVNPPGNVPASYSSDVLTATLPLDNLVSITAQSSDIQVNPWVVPTVTATVSPGPSPASSGTLTSPSATFYWNNGAGYTQFRLDVGTIVNQSTDLYYTGITTGTSVTVPIPSDGVDVYVTLHVYINGQWVPYAYNSNFKEPGTEQNATLSAPGANTATTPATLLASQPFTWTGGAGPSEYQLWVGTVNSGTGNYNVYKSGVVPNTTTAATVPIPQNGAKIYVTLRQLVDGAWQSTVYNFLEPGATSLATLTATVSPGPSPASSGTLTSPATFYWNNGYGAIEYALLLGTEGTGTSNLYDSGDTTATSLPSFSIPSNGVTVYATLKQEINGVWQTALHYTFTEPGTEQNATLSTSPTAPATINLTSPDTTFYFIGGVGPAEYYLWLGTGTTGANQYNVYKGTAGTAAQAAVTTIPDDGANIYATLFQLFNGTWTSTSYTLTAPGNPTYATLSAPGSNTATTPATLLASQQFTWTGGVGPMEYQLLLGTTGAGSSNLYVGAETTATSATVTIPSKGATVYATLRQLFNGVWHVTGYTFTEP
jgi:hypothetical protein